MARKPLPSDPRERMLAIRAFVVQTVEIMGTAEAAEVVMACSKVHPNVKGSEWRAALWDAIGAGQLAMDWGSRVTKLDKPL